MKLMHPESYSDKFLDWYAYFDAKRRSKLTGSITDEIIAEHRADPHGYRENHSPQLQRILNYMRTQPVLGKYYIYRAKDWREYRIAALGAIGSGLQFVNDEVYRSEEEAMHAVFLLRVSDMRGSTARN